MAVANDCHCMAKFTAALLPVSLINATHLTSKKEQQMWTAEQPDNIRAARNRGKGRPMGYSTIL